MDTIKVNFEVPLPKDSFNLAGLYVCFTVLPDIGQSDEKIQIDSSWLTREPIINNKAQSEIIIMKSGKQKIVGFLARKIQGKKIEYDFFTYGFFSEPRTSQ